MSSSSKRTLKREKHEPAAKARALLKSEDSWASWFFRHHSDHRTESPNVWIYGKFVYESAWRWNPIKNATHGESSVAIALAAQLTGKGLSVYSDSASDTCAKFSNQNGIIRHVKVVNWKCIGPL